MTPNHFQPLEVHLDPSGGPSEAFKLFFVLYPKHDGGVCFYFLSVPLVLYDLHFFAYFCTSDINPETYVIKKRKGKKKKRVKKQNESR